MDGTAFGRRFLWAMLDEGVVRTDLNGYVDVNRVNAPDGVLGPHREKEGSFYALKEIFSPIVISKLALPADFQGKLAVENRYHFTNLNACVFTASLVNFNDPKARMAGHEFKKSIAIPSPSVLPGKSGFLNIPLPADWKNYNGLEVHAVGPDGREVLHWTWPIDLPEKLTKELVFGELPIQENVEFEDQDSMLILRTETCAIQFDKTSGLLKNIEYKLGLSPLLGNGPVLVAGEATPVNYRHFPEADGYVLEFQYAGALKFLKWKLFANGWLQLDYEYNLESGEYPFMGISFDLPESNIIGVKWLGNGPYRVWKNRLQGGNLDVWESMYNNTHTGSAPWAYPEFKGYFSDIAWMEFNTVEGKFLVVSPQPNLFVRLFDFYGLSGPVPHPALPVGDISFLDGIPPIGTKLATGLDTKTEGLGPQSELNKGGMLQRRTLYFYFGMPPPR
ncbi:MAG: hypothetical protein H6574_01195 [Lewinellaceae bacterium]|nr:hypothetical protein [Lewinellaceae bacterium]